jgi:hypothetical protein
MPAPDLDLRHRWGGGLATDLGSVADVQASSLVELPYLLTLDNAFFEFNGSVRKVGGTSKWNSAAIDSGQEIRGMIEYVRTGTLGTPVRRRVAFAGTKIVSDNNDGVFAEIKTGLTDDAIPNFTVFTDLLILANNSSDVPMKWDQTTFANLGGSPPNFAFSVAHVNRLWAAGAAANPSRLYYSAQLNPEDWSSFDAGHIDIEPDDGDVITGLIAHRGVLFVFKGPNFGSIHVISGRTPSDFARDLFSPEVGGVGPNTSFKFGNDVGFLALDGSVRSLSATEKFGNFEEANLSREISVWMLEHMDSSALAECWAANDPTRGYVLFTVPVYGSGKPNSVLMMDYRFGKPRWGTWSAFNAYSVARMSDPTGKNRPILFLGGNDGFIRKTQQPERLIDGSVYRFFVQSPYLHYGTQNRDKTIKAAGVSFQVRGSTTVNLTMRSSHGPIQTIEFAATAGARLDLEFTLDVSALSGTQYATKWNTDIEIGQFREVSYELESFAGDVEVHALHIVPEDAQNPNYDNNE